MNELINLSVDLVAAAKLSRGLLSKLDNESLVMLENRYKMFLILKKENRKLRFAPTGDIDEMWHLHMLHPVAYVRDTTRILGYILDHNPGFGNKSIKEENELNNHFEIVKNLWEKRFNEPYIFNEKLGLDVESVVMCEDKEEDEEQESDEKKGLKLIGLADLDIESVVMCEDKEEDKEKESNKNQKISKSLILSEV